MSSNTLYKFAIIAVAIIVLYSMANMIVSSRAVPSLGEFMASSTPIVNSRLASSTDMTASTSEDIDRNSSGTNTNSASDGVSSGRLSISSTTSGLFISYDPGTASGTTSILRSINISTPKKMIIAEITSTSEEQQHGLSDRISLSAGKGMLFVFDSPGSYGFWMKDMHFPLDMVWINKNKKVVGISRNVPADSYPEISMPPSPISYVLEINAGESAKDGIVIGTILRF